VFVLLGAVRTNIFTTAATNQEIDNVIKTWLANATDRKLSDGSGGRKRRHALGLTHDEDDIDNWYGFNI
jgi:hypothetical protein